MNDDMTLKQALQTVWRIARLLIRTRRAPTVTRRDEASEWVWSEAAMDSRQRGGWVAFVGPGVPPFARPGDVWISDPTRPVKTHHTIHAEDQ